MAATHFDRSVTIFKFEYQLGFRRVDELERQGARGVTIFKIAHDAYMSIAREGSLVSSYASSDVLKFARIGKALSFFHIVFIVLLQLPSNVDGEETLKEKENCCKCLH